MTQRAVKLKIPFTQLLKIVEQLSPNERVVLRKQLVRERQLSWQERFGKALDYLGERNKGISLEKVESDITRAVKEVKAMHEGN
ncbi:hypothetical protein COX18_09360 [Candidatus Desantisbacteria bacterium CG23_combo_of_CG06-09_8_20_14_all_40_23]|uniref:Uncharacterized protein n=1 Tax=Candidatus Desantisbacteria bacterium CG23_combo_of_CG06-09_8_20_14_all_40_23 TaxID=1974550 RepID=A0A2H0A2H9_9BACT|nr:MAG: hypothetical protein COX18_09360 [Candidatus Desantisbacteria bacterium CG23_combo_of_CG06-09_8_20_14_all_40_23]